MDDLITKIVEGNDALKGEKNESKEMGFVFVYRLQVIGN